MAINSPHSPAIPLTLAFPLFALPMSPDTFLDTWAGNVPDAYFNKIWEKQQAAKCYENELE